MKTGPPSSPFNKAGSLKLPFAFEALSNQLLLKPNLHCSQGTPVWDLLNPLSTFPTAVLPNLCFPVSLADTPSIEDSFFSSFAYLDQDPANYARCYRRRQHDGVPHVDVRRGAPNIPLTRAGKKVPGPRSQSQVWWEQ